MKNELDFIPFLFFFILSFDFLFFFFILNLDESVTVIQVTNACICHSFVTFVMVMVTQSYDTEKIVEDPRTNDII